MPYITVFRPPRMHQISFDEILRGEVTCNFSTLYEPTADTITRFYPNISFDIVRKYDVPSLLLRLKTFNDANSALFDAPRQSLYRTFYIPKRSGGLRRIDAPNEQLMAALGQLKSIFESCGPLYHTSAFAYVKNRSTVDCIRRHQGNASKWFLKTDFSDFFGSTNQDFLFRMISQVFPFSHIAQSTYGTDVLNKTLSLCFLNGGLPQGTPASPMLTNLMMIPIDFKLANNLKAKGFVYTRYADDIIISSKYSFVFKDVIAEIKSVLCEFNAPFSIKASKTRYGSSNGSNWNLGVMLNKDNDITIGWKRKKQIRAMTNSYVLDRRNGHPWTYEEIAAYNGMLSYCNMVEPSFLAQLIRTTNEKHSVDLIRMIHDDLGGGGS